MLIRFQVDGEPAEFYRNWFTGRAELRLRGEAVPLQHALNPATHVSLTQARAWEHQVGQHASPSRMSGRCCWPASAPTTTACWWMVRSLPSGGATEPELARAARPGSASPPGRTPRTGPC